MKSPRWRKNDVYFYLEQSQLSALNLTTDLSQGGSLLPYGDAGVGIVDQPGDDHTLDDASAQKEGGLGQIPLVQVDVIVVAGVFV